MSRRVVSRETGEQRCWVWDHVDRRTGHAVMPDSVPVGRTLLSTDEWQSSRGSHPVHIPVRHGVHE